MNSRTNKPGMAGYAAAMKKSFTEEERFYREVWVPNLIKRRCAKCTWTEFCAKLYEVLWSEIAGWESIAYILDKLYKISGICGIVVATQAGFRSFEEMLHSNDLAHVVNIESSHKPDHPDTSPEFVKYKYRAVMDPNHFQDIRRRVKQRRPCLTAPSTGIAYPPECPKVRNVKNRDGEIISYEVDEDEQQLYEDELRNSQEKVEANIEQGEEFIEDEYIGKPCSSKGTSKIVNDLAELKLGKQMNQGSSKYYDDDADEDYYGAGQSSTSK